MSKELISKQAVLNLIDVAKNTPLKMYRGLNKHKTKLNSVMKLLEDSVNMLPDETVQIKEEWIPVSERLPEESQTEDGYFYPSDMVLTFNSHGQYGVSRYWGNRISKKERPNDYLDWMDLPFYRQDILAWQPLPEPYKEGGESE